MTSSLFSYLKHYATNPFKVNRVIISAFLYSFELQNTNNFYLQKYIIHEGETDYQNLLEILGIYRFTEIEELIHIFEFVISPEEKTINGAVYTPKNIREYIVDQCMDDTSEINNIKICDPACGCGGFLYTAAKKIHEQTGKSFKFIYFNNIFGVDIQQYAIERTKLLLILFALTEGEDSDFEFNLALGNTLNFKWSEYYPNFNGFDIIVSNPPYVCSRNIDEKSKALILDWKVSESGHPDLYIPFFQIGIENLRSNGILGFITMNSFFKSVNGRALRQYFEDNSISLKILDFGANQVFQNKSTYTCICIIKKHAYPVVEYALGTEASLTKNIIYQHIKYNNLNHKNGWNLQHNILLNRIENTGQPFGNLYRTRNGIATLMNHLYIFNNKKEDENFYYIQNANEYPIEKGICKDIINPNKFTQSKSINELRQKIIFPYEFDTIGTAKLISQEYFMAQFPMAYNYLKANKEILATRDKGKGKYEAWYAFGRNQSLEKYSNKLFFPHITSNIPNYILSNEDDLLFYNGIAVVSEDSQELNFLIKLLSSDLFWFYIVHSSKPYGSGFFSLSRNYIKNFGVAEFSINEKREMISLSQIQVNEMLSEKYKILLP